MRLTYKPNDDEAAVALTIARRRVSLNSNQSALPAEDPLRDPKNRQDRLENDYMSVLAEIATARMLNRCWTGCGIGPLGACDVGNFVQVRATMNDNYGLIVKATDKDNEPTVLILVNKQNRVCTFAGWQMSDVVKKKGKPRHEGTPKLCWILPQNELLDFKSLQSLVQTSAWVADYEKHEHPLGVVTP